jgi:uncharacterized protein YsxB (DUF464 family)
LIEVTAVLGDGRTFIDVTGHGRSTPDDIDGARVCAITSTVTEIAIAYLSAVAEQYPNHLRFHLSKE